MTPRITILISESEVSKVHNTFIPTGELVLRLNLCQPERLWLVWTPADIIDTRRSPAYSQPPCCRYSCDLVAWVKKGAQ